MKARKNWRNWKQENIKGIETKKLLKELTPRNILGTEKKGESNELKAKKASKKKSKHSKKATDKFRKKQRNKGKNKQRKKKTKH